MQQWNHNDDISLDMKRQWDTEYKATQQSTPNAELPTLLNILNITNILNILEARLDDPKCKIEEEKKTADKKLTIIKKTKTTKHDEMWLQCKGDGFVRFKLA